MKVFANGNGSRVVFTLLQRDMSEDEMARGAGMVASNLAALKTLLEG